jgi:hypothetical protein
MALPSSGPISGSQIATELSAASTNISLRSLSSTAGFSTPDAMSEFYGYSTAEYDISFYIADEKGDSDLEVTIQGTAPNNSSINVTYTVSDSGYTTPTIAFKGGTTVSVSAEASGFAGSGGLNGYAYGSSTSPYTEYDSGLSPISISNSFTINGDLSFDIYTDYP